MNCRKAGCDGVLEQVAFDGEQYWRCNRCKEMTSVVPGDELAQQWLDELPWPLARLWLEARWTDEPVLAVWKLVDTVEWLLKASVALGAGAAAMECSRAFDDPWLYKAWQMLERPSMGTWAELSGQVAQRVQGGDGGHAAGDARECTAAWRLALEVAAWRSDAAASLVDRPIDGLGEALGAQDGCDVVRLRNLLAHTGAVGATQARQVRAIVALHVAEAIESARGWLCDTRWLGWAAGADSASRWWLLRGPEEPRPLEAGHGDGGGEPWLVRAAERWAPGRGAGEMAEGTVVVVYRAEGSAPREAGPAPEASDDACVVPVWPVHAVLGACQDATQQRANAEGKGGGGTARRGKPGDGSTGDAGLCPAVYWRRGKPRHVDIARMGEPPPTKRLGEDSVEALARLFGRGRDEVEQLRAQFAGGGFGEELHAEASHVYGREGDCDAVLGAVKRMHEAQGGGPRVAWVRGRAGVGKSALMARVCVRLGEEKAWPGAVVPWQFRSHDARCTADAFARHALDYLVERGAKRGKKEASVDQRLCQALAAAGGDVLFVLDGLDEIAGREQDFAARLGQWMEAGGYWLCFGRPDRAYDHLFERAVRPFDGDLRGVDAKLIEEWLREELPSDARNALMAMPAGQRDAWMGRLEEASEGLAAYVKLVAEELGEGTLEVGDEVPEGLDAYFDRLRENYGLDDVLAVLPDAVVAAVLAPEAPPVAAVEEVLRCAESLVPETAAEHHRLVSESLDRVAALLRWRPSPWGNVVGPYHERFREYLSTHAAVKNARAKAERGWQRACRQAAKAPRRHPFLAHVAPRVFLAAGQLDEAVRALCDVSGLFARLERGGPGEADAILRDFERVEAARRERPGALAADLDEALTVYARWYGRHVHLFRRDDGPAQLLQAALMHGTRSPITQRARDLVADGSGPLPNRLVFVPRRLPAGAPVDPCVRVLVGHTQPVRALAVLPNGTLASAGEDETVRVWDPTTGRCLHVLEGHTADVNALAVLPDGTLASASSDHTVRVWDPATGHCLNVLEGHARGVRALAVLPDRTLASASQDNAVRVWDPGTGRCLRVLEGHTGAVEALAVLSDGKLASASDDRTVRVWDPATGRCLHVLEGHTDWVEALAVLPDDTLASASDDHTVRLWDPGTGRCLRVLEGHSDEVTALAVLRDGKLASASVGFLRPHDRTVRLWDPGTGRCLRVLEGHSDEVRALVVLPDGKLASANWDHTVRVWDPGTGRCLRVLEGHTGAVEALAVLSDGKLASASWDNTVRVWDPDAARCVRRGADGRFIRLLGRLRDLLTGRSQRVPEGHTKGVKALAVLLDGKLASASSDATVRVWDPGTGRCLRVLEGHTGAVEALAVLSDGKLASASWDETVRVWDPATGRCLHVLEGHTWAVQALAVLADGKLASASSDATVRVWDPATGRCLGVLKGHAGEVTALAVLPGGTLASASRDETVRVWDLATGQCLHVLKGHTDSVRALAVLPDGTLASASDDNTVRVWDAATGRCLHVLEGHTLPVKALVVLPDGRLASASDDRTVRVWDPAAGRCLHVLEGHTTAVNVLAVLANGTLASGSWDATVRVWEPAAGRCHGVYVLDARGPWSLAALQDGGLAVGCSDGLVQWFDLLAPRAPPDRQVFDVDGAVACGWRPARRQLAVAFYDGSLVLYKFHPLKRAGGRTEHLQEIERFRYCVPASRGVRALRWSADGRAVLVEVAEGEHAVVPFAEDGTFNPEWLPPQDTSSDGQLRAHLVGTQVIVERLDGPPAQ